MARFFRASGVHDVLTKNAWEESQGGFCVKALAKMETSRFSNILVRFKAVSSPSSFIVTGQCRYNPHHVSAPKGLVYNEVMSADEIKDGDMEMPSCSDTINYPNAQQSYFCQMCPTFNGIPQSRGPSRRRCTTICALLQQVEPWLLIYFSSKETHTPEGSSDSSWLQSGVGSLLPPSVSCVRLVDALPAARTWSSSQKPHLFTVRIVMKQFSPRARQLVSHHRLAYFQEKIRVERKHLGCVWEMDAAGIFITLTLSWSLQQGEYVVVQKRSWQSMRDSRISSQSYTQLTGRTMLGIPSNSSNVAGKVAGFALAADLRLCGLQAMGSLDMHRCWILHIIEYALKMALIRVGESSEVLLPAAEM